MFERFFEKEATGILKGMTLEWACPRCSGKNFRIIPGSERDSGEYHGTCRYCRVKFRVTFSPPAATLPGETAFMERMAEEDFTAEEQHDLVRDFAEIEYMRSENPGNREIAGRQRLLEEKFTFFKRRRHL